MIRGLKFAFAALLLMAFPMLLAAQSSSSKHAAVSEAPVAAGCTSFIADAATVGGSGSAAPGDNGKPSHGFDLANLDRSVSPCDDFYQFSSGGWMKNNPIPADRSTWATFNTLNASNEVALHQILEEAAKDKSAAPGSNWQKIGDFYASCMNEPQIEAAGTEAARSGLRAHRRDQGHHRACKPKSRTCSVAARTRFSGLVPQQDLKDSTQVIFAAGQGGLGLPDRQYYLDDDDRSKQLRAAYVQHVTNMFKLMGDDDRQPPPRKPNPCWISRPRSRKPPRSARICATRKRIIIMMTLAQLRDLTPHFSWADYFKEIGAPSSRKCRYRPA